MVHPDHLTIFVRSHQRAARWYVDNLGFAVEFETPGGLTTAVVDERDVTIFLTSRSGDDHEPRCVLYFEVPDVDSDYERLAANGVEVVHGPQDSEWGYGPELRDPDGHLIRLWDARTVT